MNLFDGPLTELITPRDLAGALDKSTAALASWRRHGTGPIFTKVGQAVFYQRGDVLAWLESCKVKSAAQGRLLNRRRRERGAEKAATRYEEG